MAVSSLPKTATRQRRGCDLNPGLLRLSTARQPLGYRATPSVYTVFYIKKMFSYFVYFFLFKNFWFRMPSVFERT